MIRHAGVSPPQSIAALAHPVRPSACIRPLVTPIGRTELLLPSFSSARWAAVALATVAMAADADDRPTSATATRSENNLGHGYPSLQSRYTRRLMTHACGADDVDGFIPARCSENYVFR